MISLRNSALLNGLAVFLSVVLMMFAGKSAFAEPADSGHALVELVSEQDSVVPGETYRVALVLELDPHWHVYWINAGDSGLPTELIWDETSDVETGEFVWPAPHPQPLDILMNYGYEDELILPLDITIPEDASGDIALNGTATFLICADICIPEDAPFSLTIPVSDNASPNAETTEYFNRVDAQIPMALDGEAFIDRSETPWRLSIVSDIVRAALEADIADIRFFPLDHQILHPPEQPVSFGPDGITLELQPGGRSGLPGDLAGVLVVEDTDGNRVAFDLTASPGLVEAGATGETLSEPVLDAPPLDFVALLGVLGGAFLGGLILNLMPCVLPVLFIKARGILSLSGSAQMGEIRAHGLFYALGVVICFLAFAIVLVMLRAAGETAGLGFQLQYPVVIAGLSLLMFVLGLNMIGWFSVGGSVMGVGSDLAERGGHQGAFFTGLLAAFVGAPCIGPFLGAAVGAVVDQPLPVVMLVFAVLGIGMATPFLLISLFPGVAKLLPKPGAWMERLKQFFAFPLFLTAIWLLWVLAQQSGADAVALVGGAATLIAFGIWMFKAAPEKGSTRNLVLGAGVLVILLALVFPALMLRSTASYSVAGEAGAAHAGYDGDWSPQAVADLQAEGRAVLVDFTASWCVTCQVNKRTTLLTDRVQSALEDENVALLIADWTSRDDMIADELARHGRAGVPLYLYYSADGSDPAILPQILSPSIVVDYISQ
ncbi:thioredoxin family protein [Ponticaulis sp.]|uniref:protein-disulfide reductase DsbD family protein n=1 Tax=Ponticaulis sp. TaxID=2020902 RepID=UPI0025F941A9|nr:thioredoxin family protein [Ponticaulis sp.]|tara:strand:+ start:185367 stop:187514 length:2148 start_codon:yes stop_codon:yes gene_type:complete